jgi:hypothetical protein
MAMEYPDYGLSDSDDEDTGVRHINRLLARYDGHTHIYQYPRGLAWKARAMVKTHVEEGTLHPYAGLILMAMLGRSDGD